MHGTNISVYKHIHQFFFFFFFLFLRERLWVREGVGVEGQREREILIRLNAGSPMLGSISQL